MRIVTVDRSGKPVSTIRTLLYPGWIIESSYPVQSVSGGCVNFTDGSFVNVSLKTFSLKGPGSLDVTNRLTDDYLDADRGTYSLVYYRKGRRATNISDGFRIRAETKDDVGLNGMHDW